MGLVPIELPVVPVPEEIVINPLVHIASSLLFDGIEDSHLDAMTVGQVWPDVAARVQQPSSLNPAARDRVLDLDVADDALDLDDNRLRPNANRHALIVHVQHLAAHRIELTVSDIRLAYVDRDESIEIPYVLRVGWGFAHRRFFLVVSASTN